MWSVKKRGVDPDNIKLMLGVDGGQGKLLCTIVPNNEKDKMGRMSQTNVKDRSKSTSVKRCLVVGRVDSIPENYSNITVLMSKMNLPALRNDFCVVAITTVLNFLHSISVRAKKIWMSSTFTPHLSCTQAFWAWGTTVWPNLSDIFQTKWSNSMQNIISNEGGLVDNSTDPQLKRY